MGCLLFLFTVLLTFCFPNVQITSYSLWNSKNVFLNKGKSTIVRNLKLPAYGKHIFSLDVPALTALLGGSGRAKIFWDHIKDGVDPLSEDSSLSPRVKTQISSKAGSSSLITNEITNEIKSEDGTIKLLIRLSDALEIETVLIPTPDRTTACISTQIGCDRGCIFCLTGKMGIVRNLTSTEMINQVIRGIQIAKREKMPRLGNVVFMGMGDAGRNIDEVKDAVLCLTDNNRFSFNHGKVTVSTVGPSPDIFEEIALLPCAVAWSLHSPIDSIRRKLVPTSSRHTTVQLRDGLMKAMQLRPDTSNHRAIMIAVTLLDGINDREEDAKALLEFIEPLSEICPKILINLLPYNDINVPFLHRPPDERIEAFQDYITSFRRKGIFCTMRTTRGEKENAACGMLATKSKRGKRIFPGKEDSALI
jgi:23S rRNA (adenine2503-C2)-methyltransferase